MTNRYFLKLGIVFTLFLACAAPKKITVLPIPDDFSQAENLCHKDPLAALEFYRCALARSPDSLLKNQILNRIYDIYFDQRAYRLASALAESLPREPLPSLPVILTTLKKYDEILNSTALPALTKARAAEQSERLDDALVYYELAKPQAFDYCQLKIAKLLYKLGRYDSSKAVLRTLSDTPAATMLLVDIALAESSWVSAKTLIDRLPFTDIKLKNLITVQEMTGGDATPYYWELVEKFPQSPFAKQAAPMVIPQNSSQYYYLGKLLADSDPKTAEQYLKKCLKGGRREDATRLLARLYLNQGKLKAAEQALKTSTTSENRYLLARVLNRQGLKEEAIKIYIDVAHRSPKLTLARDATLQAGLLLEESDRADSACVLYARSGDGELISRAGVFLLTMNKPDSAVKVLSKTVTAESYYFRAKVFEEIGLNREADSLYRKLIEKFPESYWTMKTVERPEYESCTPLADSEVEPWLASWTDTTYTLNQSDSLSLNRASVFLEAGLVDEAVTELKSIENNNPLFLYRLAQLCVQFGLDNRSIYYANKIAKLAPEKILPRALVQLLYPFRYGVTIQANEGELPFVLSVIRQESWFYSQAVSSAQAHGLMQIIPSTGNAIAKTLDIADFKVEDLDTPELNIKFGIRYLSDMEKQFGSKYLALAAYNGGPGNVGRWLKLRPSIGEDEFIGLIPFNETRNYVKSCLTGYYIYQKTLTF